MHPRVQRALRSAFRVFLAGGVAGWVGDYVHVRTGTTAYAGGVGWSLGGLPFWVFLLMGVSAVAMGVGQTGLAGLIRSLVGVDTGRAPRPGERQMRGIWAGLLCFLGSYVASGLIPVGAGKDVAIFTLAAAAWVTLDRSALGLALHILSATMGCAVEIFLIHRGIFSYSPDHRVILGMIPLWLPALYVSASIAAGNAFRRFRI